MRTTLLAVICLCAALAYPASAGDYKTAWRDMAADMGNRMFAQMLLNMPSPCLRLDAARASHWEEITPYCDGEYGRVVFRGSMSPDDPEMAIQGRLRITEDQHSLLAGEDRAAGLHLLLQLAGLPCDDIQAPPLARGLGHEVGCTGGVVYETRMAVGTDTMAFIVIDKP